jgi:hypothetical protein
VASKDEKSKLKRTQALSPDEAEKARERLRAAIAQAGATPPAAPSPPMPRPEVPAARAGTPLSPFDAPGKTQVLGADDARKALEQVAKARAATTAAPLQKTQVISQDEAQRARELVRAKAGESPSKISRKPPKTDAPSKMRRESPSKTGKRPAVNPALMTTLPLAGAPRRPETSKPDDRQSSAPTGPPPAPPRAGAPISPFDAPAPRTQVLGADDARKALEQVARARAAALPAAVEKTQIMAPQEAKRAREQVRSKTGDSPSKIARKPPKTADAPSKIRRESHSKIGKKPAVSPALMKTLPLSGPPAAQRAPVAKTRARKPKVAAVPAKPSPPVAPAAEPLMRGAKLRGARLVRADLRGADLSGSDFADADLAYADLSHARLQDADLSFTNLYKTKLDGAELRGSNRFGTRKTNPDRA